MSRWGVGPRFIGLVILCLGITCAARWMWPAVFQLGFVPYSVLVTVGTLLIVLGLIVKISGGATVMRAYNADTLCTHGICGVCRHPIYASWVVFLVPGIALLLNSWITLAAVPVLYAALRLFVRDEEAYLERRFGDEYRAYKRRVPAVLPLGWLRRR